MTAEAAETGENRQAGNLPRCKATCLDGAPCKAAALPGQRTCLFHSPDAAALLADARKKGGLTRAAMLLPVALGIGELDWQTPAGLVRIMAAAGEKMLAGQLDPARARALSEMAGRMLAALSGQVMEERLDALEERISRIVGLTERQVAPEAGETP